MDISDWIALGALAIAALGPTMSSLRITGRREGKIDATLEKLADITGDHETRIRVLEHDDKP
jgi:hypothetical protein